MAETSHVYKAPIVTKDARYRAARKLIESGRGQLGAIEMFETLVNRAEEEFGENSIDTATVYYELGNAMYRNTRRGRPTNSSVFNNDDFLEDALQYMVKSCSILYNHSSMNDDVNKDEKDAKSENEATNEYSQWVKVQLPRVLIGIGEIQSYQGKHADAIDSYLNAVPFREEAIQEFKKLKPNKNEDNPSGASESVVSSLKSERLLTETYILIAEELLVNPIGKDMIHSETGNTIIKADEIPDLAKSYYEQGKDKLQEIVYKMASIEEQAPSSMPDSEKQGICHLATMLMEVGMDLARLDDERKAIGNPGGPVAEKRRV